MHVAHDDVVVHVERGTATLDSFFAKSEFLFSGLVESRVVFNTLLHHFVEERERFLEVCVRFVEVGSVGVFFVDFDVAMLHSAHRAVVGSPRAVTRVEVDSDLVSLFCPHGGAE